MQEQNPTNSSVSEHRATCDTSPVPQTICFEPLYLCNIRCNYCYIGEVRNIQSPSLPPLEHTMRILDTIHSAGVNEIYLAGGEPCAHPAFDLICQHIHELGFVDKGLVTNGTLVTEKRAHLLAQLGFWVNVSFRGPNQDIFDTIARTPGAYKRALRGLRFLKGAGLQVALEYDPVPENYRFLYETVQTLISAGIEVREVWLHRIAPFGDAPSVARLTIEEYREVFRQAKRIRRDFGINAIFEDSFPLCLIDEEYRPYTEACDCGVTLGNVDPFGNVRRCACHPKNLGNVLSTPLNELWDRGLQHFRSNIWLDQKCQNCALLARCGGGCSVSGASDQGYGVDTFVADFKTVCC